MSEYLDMHEQDEVSLMQRAKRPGRPARSLGGPNASGDMIADHATAGETEKAAALIRTRRSRRRHAAGTELKLSHHRDKNWHYRWVNDLGNRVQKLLDMGYEYAPNDHGEFTLEEGRIVREGSFGNDARNENFKKVLLRLPMEEYLYEKRLEDEEKNTKLEHTMNKGKPVEFSGGRATSGEAGDYRITGQITER